MSYNDKPCCSEAGCNRRSPYLIRIGPFSRRWVLITRWHSPKDHPERVISDQKHDIHDQILDAFAYKFEQHGWMGFTGAYYPPETPLAAIHAEERGGYYPVYRERDHE